MISKQKITLLLFLLICSSQIGYGKKLLGIPKDLVNPADQIGFLEDINAQKLKKLSEETPWVVYVDRVNNVTNKGEKLTFGTYFYVLDQDDTRIEIGTARIIDKLEARDIKSKGWIDKKKMLLWGNSLRKEDSFIKLKAFILYKVEDVEEIYKGNKKLIKIYGDPTKNDTLSTIRIYDFYFILKKEGSRVLVSRSPRLSRRKSTQQLIGWVRESNITEWNTRIALEPNFKSTAFDRRIENSALRVRGYDDRMAAISMEKSGTANKTPYWDKDPAYLKDTDGLVKTGNYAGKRFNGNVIRFPLLRKYKNAGIIKSGIIGNVVLPTFGASMTDISYSEIVQSITNHLEAKKRYNLLFVIEGTQYMSQHKSAIIAAIKAASQTVKAGGIQDISYSIAIYRDINESQEKRRYEALPLTPRIEEATNFVASKDFYSWEDNEPYTAMNYGLHEGIIDAGIDPTSPATNIVFLIGQNGDFTCDRIRRHACTTDINCKEQYYFKSSPLIKKLSDLNAHFVVLQTEGVNDKASECFQERSTLLMEETAKQLFDIYTNVEIHLDNITLSPPQLQEVDGRWEIKNGTITGRLAKVNVGTIESEMVDAIKQVKKFNESFSKQMQGVITEGEMSVASGSLSPQVTELIFKVIEEGNLDPQAIIKFLLSEKYKLYVECYFPLKIGAEDHASLSPVVMVSKEDLNTYKEYVLDKLNELHDHHSLTEKRRVLQDEIFLEAFKEITGNDNLSKAEFSESSLIKIHPVSEDIQNEFGEELNLPSWLFTPIKDIGKMEMAEIDTFIEMILQNSDELINIRNAAERYEFAYKTPTWAIDNDPENLYFWIPVEKMF